MKKNINAKSLSSKSKDKQNKLVKKANIPAKKGGIEKKHKLISRRASTAGVSIREDIKEAKGPGPVNDSKKAAKMLLQKLKKKLEKESKLKNDTEKISQRLSNVGVSKVITEDAKEENGSVVTSDAKKIAKKLRQKLRRKLEKEASLANNDATNKLQPPGKLADKNDKLPISLEGSGSTAKSETLTTSNVKKQKKSKQLKTAEDNKKKEARTVFVGNLPVNIKLSQLKQVFIDYGPVGTIRLRTADGKKFMNNKQRKASASLIAYVALKDEETANRALALNGTLCKSNHLRITKADKKSHGKGEIVAKKMIFVGNLKHSTKEDDLREIFSSCGDIEYVRCLQDGNKGCNGVAYVCFKSPEAVGLALELNETLFNERPIRVERYSVKKLGAKQSPNAAVATKNLPTGAKRRLDMKNKIKNKNKAITTEGDATEKKKAKFRGVKTVINMIQKKKKPSKQFLQLAKKIAPKSK